MGKIPVFKIFLLRTHIYSETQEKNVHHEARDRTKHGHYALHTTGKYAIFLISWVDISTPTFRVDISTSSFEKDKQNIWHFFSLPIYL